METDRAQEVMLAYLRSLEAGQKRIEDRFVELDKRLSTIERRLSPLRKYAQEDEGM